MENSNKKEFMCDGFGVARFCNDLLFTLIR